LPEPDRERRPIYCWRNERTAGRALKCVRLRETCGVRFRSGAAKRSVPFWQQFAAERPFLPHFGQIGIGQTLGSGGILEIGKRLHRIQRDRVIPGLECLAVTVRSGVARKG